VSILRFCDQEPAAIGPDSSAAEAIELMVARRVGAVAVVDANRVIGIFTERDVLRKLAISGRDPGAVPVRELMTAPVEVISPDTFAGDALGMMVDHHFRHLPIVDSSGKLLGLLSVRNLLQAQIEDLREQLNSLEQYVSNDAPGG
jgi:CBS domain-containing protein